MPQQMSIRPALTLHPAYTYCGRVYCAGCVPNPRDRAPTPIRQDDDWVSDEYPICVNCGQVHTHVTLVEPEQDEYYDEESGDYDEYDEDSEVQEDDVGLKMREADDF